MVVLPGLLLLPGVRVKLTVFPLRFTVSDSARLAFKVMGCAPELSCADASDAAHVTASRTAAIRTNRRVFISPPRKSLFDSVRAGFRVLRAVFWDVAHRHYSENL